jgi:hypothetical protein
MARQGGLDSGPAVASVRSQQPLTDGFGDEALELDRGLARCELDEHPWHGAHAEVAAGADVGGVGFGLGAMDGEEGVPSATGSRQGELDLTEVHNP